VDLEKIVKALTGHDVDFVIVGGVAAVLHGSSYSTTDFDICYSREARNIQALIAALSPFHPRLRGKNIPGNLPFRFDAETLRRGLNFTFTTDEGDVDLLGEIQGLGGYAEVLKNSDQIEIFGASCRVMSLEDLVRAKKAAARGKDLILVKELEALLELHKRSRSGEQD
jgi:predicted nucleotidyltransferase